MFDFAKILEDTGNKLAEIKGYNSVTDLISGTAAKNVARITDKPNEVKQTPPVVTPTEYTMQMLSEQNSLGMSNGKLLLISGAVVLAAVLLLKKRGK